MSSQEIDYLTVEDLLEIAAGVLEQVVVRDAGALTAAAARPRATVFAQTPTPASRKRPQRCCILSSATTPS